MAGTWWLLGTGVLHGEGQPLAGPRVLNELIADDIRCAMVCAWPPIPTAAGAILSQVAPATHEFTVVQEDTTVK